MQTGSIFYHYSPCRELMKSATKGARELNMPVNIWKGSLLGCNLTQKYIGQKSGSANSSSILPIS